MDYSRKIAERQWNLPDKGELESRRAEHAQNNPEQGAAPQL